MKKVGILTFQNSANFGAQLQAYALQKSIEKMNFYTEVINYSLENKSLKEKILFNFKLLVKSILLNPRKYRIFKKQYNLSKEKYDDTNIEKANDQYDIFVTGSDQVWNPRCCKKTNTYLLGFTNKQKISYAASFGVEQLDKDLWNFYIKPLSSIDCVSIREKQGCKIYKELIEKEAVTVLDPTFLISKDEWNNNFDLKSKDKDYVLIYMLEYSKELVNMGKKYAKDNNLNYKIISGTPRAWYFNGVQWNMSPQKFLKLYYNSKYVFTNSFHGTAFAINFKKEFFVKLLVKNTKVNNRLTNVLSTLKLENRIISNYDSINKLEKIDYFNVSNLLDNQIKMSKDFLKKSLEGNYYEK